MTQTLAVKLIRRCVQLTRPYRRIRDLQGTLHCLGERGGSHKRPAGSIDPIHWSNEEPWGSRFKASSIDNKSRCRACSDSAISEASFAIHFWWTPISPRQKRPCPELDLGIYPIIWGHNLRLAHSEKKMYSTGRNLRCISILRWTTRFPRKTLICDTAVRWKVKQIRQS